MEVAGLAKQTPSCKEIMNRNGLDLDPNQAQALTQMTNFACMIPNQSLPPVLEDALERRATLT